MAMGPIKSLIIVVILLFLSPVAQGQGQLLLIDRSGSMKPYYENGLIAELGQRITGIMREQSLSPVTITAFNNQVETVQDIAQIAVGGPTHLDVAIDYAVNHHYVVVWMVTDNIMHRQGEEEGKTQVFYDRLKASAVARVVIFPLKQAAGQGKAGIIVYALLLSPNGSDTFKKETEQFESQTRNTVLLPMKPLDRDTIETAFEQTGSEDRNKVYSDGSVVSETLGLSFKSKFDHLNIVDAEIVNPRVAPEFSKNSLLAFEKDDVKITPTRITELGPRSKTIQVYKVRVDLGRIKLKRDLVSLWRAALKDPNEEISLDLSFSINVPKEKFQFTPDFLRDYSAETTEKAKAEGKIYALDQLPLLVANDQTSIEVPHKPKIRVRYPSWLVFVFPGLPILGLLIVVAGGIYASRAVKKMARRKLSWTVDVREPMAAEGRIRDAWVIVTVDGKHNRLGRINKTNFVPTTGVTPKEPQGVKEGLPLSLTFRKKEYSIIFRRPASGDGVAPTRKEKAKDGERNEIKI